MIGEIRSLRSQKLVFFGLMFVTSGVFIFYTNMQPNRMRGKRFWETGRPTYYDSNRCKELCVGQLDQKHSDAGYPFTPTYDYGEFVSSVMFRDFAHYVVSWPYANFKEPLQEPNYDQVIDCLPPVPIIFSKQDPQHVAWFRANMVPHLGDYVLVTSQTDWSAPNRNKGLLDDKRLLRWFATNPDIEHPKLEAIPYGINVREMGPALRKFRNGFGESELADKINKRRMPVENLALINFGTTHSKRLWIRELLCNKSFVDCLEKLPLEQLYEVYNTTSRYPFWISPRGNGLDVIRHIEAQYIGAIPIIESSLLDPVYEDMRVLAVNNYTEISETFLRKQLKEISGRTFNYAKLTRRYWWDKINSVRLKRLKELNLTDVDESRRCWITAIGFYEWAKRGTIEFYLNHLEEPLKSLNIDQYIKKIADWIEPP